MRQTTEAEAMALCQRHADRYILGLHIGADLDAIRERNLREKFAFICGRDPEIEDLASELQVVQLTNEQDEREYSCPFCTCMIALPYRDITRAVTCQVCETVWDVRRDAYGYFQVFREIHE